MSEKMWMEREKNVLKKYKIVKKKSSVLNSPRHSKMKMKKRERNRKIYIKKKLFDCVFVAMEMYLYIYFYICFNKVHINRVSLTS